MGLRDVRGWGDWGVSVLQVLRLWILDSGLSGAKRDMRLRRTPACGLLAPPRCYSKEPGPTRRYEKTTIRRGEQEGQGRKDSRPGGVRVGSSGTDVSRKLMSSTLWTSPLAFVLKM